MSNLKVSCPLCAQVIEVDSLRAGQQINCPHCQGSIALPELPAAPKVGRLSVAAAPAGHVSAPPAPQPVVQQKKPLSPEKKKQIITWVLAIVLLPVGIYFAFPYAKKYQEKFSSGVDEAGKNSGGGELGHIAELNSVLDATEPSKHETFTTDRLPDAAREQAPKPVQKKELPIIPPTWTLDIDSVQIEESKVNGMVSGEVFVSDLNRFDRNGPAYFLNFRQGTNATSDREITVFLRLKAGEKIETNSWDIAKKTVTGAPQIVKKWKTGARFIGQKTFSTGYVMKLEFGEITQGIVPGKIYIALPDAEKTVIAGHFQAETQLLGAKEAATQPANY